MREHISNGISRAGERVRTAFVVVGALVVVVGAAGCGGSKSTSDIPGATGLTTSLPKTIVHAKTQRVLLSLASLRDYAHRVKHTVYWVGPMKNAEYEVTYTPGGNFTVRYLAAQSKVGAKNYIVLVSTDPVWGGYDLLKQLTVESGMHAVHAPKAVAVTSDAYPQSIRVAFPKKDFQIEVISPSAARVKQLVTTGSVEPIS